MCQSPIPAGPRPLLRDPQPPPSPRFRAGSQCLGDRVLLAQWLSAVREHLFHQPLPLLPVAREQDQQAGFRDLDQFPSDIQAAFSESGRQDIRSVRPERDEIPSRTSSQQVLGIASTNDLVGDLPRCGLQGVAVLLSGMLPSPPGLIEVGRVGRLREGPFVFVGTGSLVVPARVGAKEHDSARVLEGGGRRVQEAIVRRAVGPESLPSIAAVVLPAKPPAFLVECIQFRRRGHEDTLRWSRGTPECRRR